MCVQFTDTVLKTAVRYILYKKIIMTYKNYIISGIEIIGKV